MICSMSHTVKAVSIFLLARRIASVAMMALRCVACVGVVYVSSCVCVCGVCVAGMDYLYLASLQTPWRR